MIIEIPDDNSIIKWKKNDKDDWNSAEILDLIKTYEGRPKGKWIDHKLRDDIVVEHAFKCSRCKQDSGLYYPTDFCSNCGADLRGDTQ